MITMKKTKGLLALAIGVAMCFAVSAYALTAPRDTQGSISDNASDEPFPNFPQMKIFSLIPLLITLILMLLSKPRTPLMPTTKQKKLILLTEYCRPYAISRIPSTGFTAKKWAFGCLPPCQKICK